MKGTPVQPPDGQHQTVKHLYNHDIGKFIPVLKSAWCDIDDLTFLIALVDNLEYDHRENKVADKKKKKCKVKFIYF